MVRFFTLRHILLRLDFYVRHYGGKVTIPSRIDGKPVTVISYNAFRECTSITSVIIPNSVTNIYFQAFLYCSNITNVTLGNSVTRIDRLAFMDCSSLTNITIPKSVVHIEESVFSGCFSLTSVTFEGSINSSNFSWAAFGTMSDYIGDLRDKYLSGGIGTYTRSGAGSYDDPYIWTKQ